MRNTFAREHLARRCDRAETRRKVERAAAIPAARQRHRLAGVQPDADPERQLDATATLHLDRCAQSLPRGSEDDQRLVPAELDQIAVVLGDNTADDVRERRGELSRSFVAVLLREARVTADVGDQERTDDRGQPGLALPSIASFFAAVDVSV